MRIARLASAAVPVALASAALVSAPADASAGQNSPYLPTFTLAAAGDAESELYFHSWAGLAVHSVPHKTLTPYYAVGIEFDVRGHKEPSGGEGTILDFRPAARAGLALWANPRHALLPIINVYGLASYHPESDHRPRSIRLGVGAAIPPLIVTFQIPTVFELTVERSADEQVAGFRIGWGM